MATGGTPYKKKKPVAKAKKKPALAKKKPLTIDQKAKATAQTTIAPQLAELDIASRDAASKHATREQQQKGWYGGFANTLNDAYGRTTAALNSLISLNNTGTAQNQQVLRAALNQGQSGVNQAASSLGVSAPTSAQTDIMSSALANSDASRNLIGSNALGLQAAEGQRLSLAPIAAIQAGTQENSRYGAETAELAAQRRGITSQSGALEAKARTDLENQAFQQYLAEQELGLKKKGQTFDQYMAGQNLDLERDKLASQTAIDWANVAVNQRQVEAQLATIDKEAKTANTAEAKERAKLRGQQWVTGLDMLAGYLKPAEGEAAIGDENPVDDPNTLDKDESTLPKYRRRYDDALRILTGQARMSRSDALRLLAASDFASWRSRARKELTKLKRRPNNAAKLGLRADRKKNQLKKKPPVPGLKKG